MKEFTAA